MDRARLSLAGVGWEERAHTLCWLSREAERVRRTVFTQPPPPPQLTLFSNFAQCPRLEPQSLGQNTTLKWGWLLEIYRVARNQLFSWCSNMENEDCYLQSPSC